jgi:hypothetical protein
MSRLGVFSGIGIGEVELKSTNDQRGAKKKAGPMGRRRQDRAGQGNVD